MKKVLVVDDAPLMRLLIKDAIESAGFEVVGEAEDGAQAVDRFLALKPDVVTLDLVMPRVSGLEGLKSILQQDASAKVIILSALDQQVELKQAIAAGAIDFIVKPFDQERVANALRRAID